MLIREYFSGSRPIRLAVLPRDVLVSPCRFAIMLQFLTINRMPDETNLLARFVRLKADALQLVDLASRSLHINPTESTVEQLVAQTEALNAVTIEILRQLRNASVNLDSDEKDLFDRLNTESRKLLLALLQLQDDDNAPGFEGREIGSKAGGIRRATEKLGYMCGYDNGRALVQESRRFMGSGGARIFRLTTLGIRMAVACAAAEQIRPPEARP